MAGYVEVKAENESLLYNMMFKNKIGLIKNIKLLDDEHPLPTSVDLRGAALAIARVQETYKLNTTDLTKGKIRNYEAKCVPMLIKIHPRI